MIDAKTIMIGSMSLQRWAWLFVIILMNFFAIAYLELIYINKYLLLGEYTNYALVTVGAKWPSHLAIPLRYGVYLLFLNVYYYFFVSVYGNKYLVRVVVWSNVKVVILAFIFGEMWVVCKAFCWGLRYFDAVLTPIFLFLLFYFFCKIILGIKLFSLIGMIIFSAVLFEVIVIIVCFVFAEYIFYDSGMYREMFYVNCVNFCYYMFVAILLLYKMCKGRERENGKI